MDAGNHSEAQGSTPYDPNRPNRNPRTYLTDPAVVDKAPAKSLAAEATAAGPSSSATAAGPGQPLPHIARSAILPRIELSDRYHPELHAAYSTIWGCQASVRWDKEGKKIPTSRIDFSQVHTRCGKKEYDGWVNGHAFKACKNCEVGRFYTPRRPSQDQNEEKMKAWQIQNFGKSNL